MTDARTIAVRGLVAAALGAAVNAALVVGAGAVGIAPDFRALTLPPVVFLSVAGAVGATVVYAAVGRRGGRNPDRTFTRIAAAALALSFLPDLALLVVDPAATLAGVVLLMVMHVVVAAASVGLLTGQSAGVGGRKTTRLAD